jgi:CelD/BcsL family acetyltransferase involved in cellulose biosynthesis
MAGKEPGDYWDVLAEPALRAPVTAALADAIVRRRGAWDVLSLDCLPPGSPTPSALRRAGFTGYARASIRSPRLTLPDSFETYLASLSRNPRGNLRRHLRRLDDGTVQLREVTGPADLEETLTQLAGSPSPSVGRARAPDQPEHAAERFRAFMLDAVRRLVPAGLALVWELRHEDEIAGVYVNFMDERSFYWYLGGFDPALTSTRRTTS